ncbi:NAD(P)H-dependent FMN reductase [Spirosomataceae bacterium TFI 002]|nr:NAD(P)H-dependent FMN reductase [Spirosomataceae bacterium TFI 002]
MNKRFNILAINGSASENSSNLSILRTLVQLFESKYNIQILDDLSEFPHFRTELTNENVPAKILELRSQIEKADGVIICTPEYIFSIPSGLKNIIEWCVSTTVFTDKPIGLITASANGEMGHKELLLIMKTLQAKLTSDTTLLIRGVKGRVNKDGQVIDENTEKQLRKFVLSMEELIS